MVQLGLVKKYNAVFLQGPNVCTKFETINDFLYVDLHIICKSRNLESSNLAIRLNRCVKILTTMANGGWSSCYKFNMTKLALRASTSGKNWPEGPLQQSKTAESKMEILAKNRNFGET